MVGAERFVPLSKSPHVTAKHYIGAVSQTLPNVSIIIPAYNEQATIRSCLLAAVMQTVPATEIIVVDNKSTDATAEVVRSVMAEHPTAPIMLIAQNDAQGLIPTRNLGLNTATGDVLGRIDADSILEPNWVEQVQLAFADDEIAAATGPVLYYDMPLRRFGLRADDRTRRVILKLSRDYHFLFGSNMAIRASAWLEIRDTVCRDEADLMHEDIDLSIHLAQHDLKITYVSEMISGMSARRLEDSLRDYTFYVNRFERTYSSHRLRNPMLRAPMVVFFFIYPLAKLMRSMKQRNDRADARK